MTPASIAKGKNSFRSATLVLLLHRYVEILFVKIIRNRQKYFKIECFSIDIPIN